MINFTVAISTYNGEKRLVEVLERLRSQIDTEHLSWEIIVVNNNSTDKTAQVVREYQANWNKTYPLKYYFEAEQGTEFARQRAVEEAQGEFIGFLDDDNLPTYNWVAAAYAFGKDHPEVGAYGSQIHGEFELEVELPKNFHKIACFLAIVERGSKAHRYEPCQKMLPPGAGLVVRKKVWLESVPKRLFLNHKGKEGRLSSEDLEALLHIQQAGWEIWYNPEMCIHHKIPRWRLERDYLIALLRRSGFSRYHIRMLRIKAWQKPLFFPLYLLNDLNKIILHLIKYQKAIKSDIVPACELQFLLTTLISPFYLWRKRYLDAKQTVLKLQESRNLLVNFEPDVSDVKL